MKSNIQFHGEANIPTDFGTFRMRAYSERPDERMPHLAMINPKTKLDSVVNVRIHSECMTGDVFGSNRCECGDQLEQSLELIGDQGGVLIYLRQEGRGIGLINKLHAYVKQDQGYDTAEANEVLGHAIDSRKYDIAIDILKELQITEINLITNNPEKIKALEKSDIALIERIPLEIQPKKENLKYLETKKKSFGHLLSKVKSQ